MLNIKKIEDRIGPKKITKAKLCKSAGIARTTLDAVLNKEDARISTIEKIAQALGVTIGYLFDEDRQVGGHYEANGPNSFIANQAQYIDNRTTYESVTSKTDSSVITLESIVLPENCPQGAIVLIQKLQSETALLKSLIEEKERFIRHMLHSTPHK